MDMENKMIALKRAVRKELNRMVGHINYNLEYQMAKHDTQHLLVLTINGTTFKMSFDSYLLTELDFDDLKGYVVQSLPELLRKGRLSLTRRSFEHFYDLDS
ncbi:hypothetical protein [Vibrio sp.]|uniref:hypothetical protein n=1 Tax=Vibrio sp. TaxID=678 RepID=UPI003D0E3162